MLNSKNYDKIERKFAEILKMLKIEEETVTLLRNYSLFLI